MEIIKNIDSKLKELFGGKQNGKARFVLILGCVGILLIFLSELFPKNVTEYPAKENTNFYELSDSETKIEKRIEEAVSKIKGAGRTHVTITFDSSEEFFYAKNSSENVDESEKSKEYEFVIIEGKNGDEPIVLKKSEAKIRGILIVCDGGKNPLVCEKIIEAVCALLDIPSNKVSVAEMA